MAIRGGSTVHSVLNHNFIYYTFAVKLCHFTLALSNRLCNDTHYGYLHMEKFHADNGYGNGRGYGHGSRITHTWKAGLKEGQHVIERNMCAFQESLEQTRKAVLIRRLPQTKVLT